MRKLILSILGLTIFFQAGFNQSSIDSLVVWSSKLLDVKLGDETKLNYNEKFIEAFTEDLSLKGSIENDYSKLKSVSVQTAKDKSFRIFTWFVITKNGYQTFGLVQSANSKSKNPIVTRLNDKGEDLRSAQFKNLNAKTWFGALYYDMVPFKIKGKKYYMVLGFNPGNGLSHKKVIDVIQIMANGQPRFGAPIFEKDKKMANRIILEYDARAKVSLKYYEETKMVIFDHLAPSRPEFLDQYQYYVPDLSYDAFEFGKDEWNYKADVDARNADENLGSDGNRLVIDGVNDQKTLENKISGEGSANDQKK